MCVCVGFICLFVFSFCNCHSGPVLPIGGHSPLITLLEKWLKDGWGQSTELCWGNVCWEKGWSTQGRSRGRPRSSKSTSWPVVAPEPSSSSKADAGKNTRKRNIDTLQSQLNQSQLRVCDMHDNGSAFLYPWLCIYLSNREIACWQQFSYCRVKRKQQGTISWWKQRQRWEEKFANLCIKILSTVVPTDWEDMVGHLVSPESEHWFKSQL